MVFGLQNCTTVRAYRGCISGCMSGREIKPVIVLRRKDASTMSQIQITEREFLKNHTKWVYELMEFGDYYPVLLKKTWHWQI
jgi:hypothetical protein